MNTKMLAEILDKRAAQILDTEEGNAERRDDAELFQVLARIVRGKPLEKAFGAPGDWGYSTAIGKALAAVPEPKPRDPYPEHAKMAAVVPQSQAQGAFLEWMEIDKSIVPAICDDHGRLEPFLGKVETLLAEFHGINLKKIEQEKQAMIEFQRNLNAAPQP